MSNETVRFDILIQAKAAIKELREMSEEATSVQERVAKFSSFLVMKSKEWNVPIQQLLGTFKQLNAEMAKSKTQTIFGNTGGKNVFNMSEEFLKSAEAADRFKTNAAGVVTSTKAVSSAAKEVGNNAESGFSRAISGVNALRIALGAIVSMILFQVIQAFQEFFTTAVKNAQELEASLYRIHNAERILSSEGINVSTSGLEEGIKRIKKLLPIFSKEDITGLVGQIAITTKSLGLTEKQIVDLAQSIAILNVNSAEEESLQQTAQHVISSLLTSNAKGVANLGIVMGDAAIKAKAFEMGMLSAGQSASDLSDAEKKIVKVQIAIDAGASSIQGLNEFLDTNTAKIQMNKAAWNDLLTTIGQALLPFIPAATAGFNALDDAANSFKAIIASIGAVLLTYLTIFRMVMSGNIKSLDELKNKFTEVSEAAKKLVYGQFFPEGTPDNAPAWFKKGIGKYLTTPETPTGSKTFGEGEDGGGESDKKLKKVQDTEQKIQDAMKDSADKKLDIERDYGRKLEDIATGYSQKLEDIARKTAEKEEDALRNYNQKVEDINRDAAEKIAEAQADERKKELDRESEFQNRLRELREKFLFDLEDALRERDARQVLRLIRQYNMDKNNLEEKHKLEQQQAKKDLATKLADIEYERQKKLESAKREYDEKLHEIQIAEARERTEAALWKKRQLEDARLWHQRQLDEQRQYLQRKLRDLADALKAEYNLTSAGAQAMTSLLSSAYGAYANLLSQFSNGTMTPVSANGAITGGSLVNSFPDFASTFSSLTSGHGYGFAEGGTLIATRPTRALFGENGPERVDITPLNHVGKNVGKVFGDTSSMGGGGSVKIALELSPDLEARIIESSLDGMAVTLEKVIRSK